MADGQPVESSASLPQREGIKSLVFGKQESVKGKERPQQSARQAVFSLWCDGNGMATPRFVSRERWQAEQQSRVRKEIQHAQEQGANMGPTTYFQLESDGRHLVLPNDLRPWEIVPLLRELDSTLPPENRTNRSLEVLQLGTLLRNSGIYLATRLDEAFPTNMQTEYLQTARGVATNLAEDFYNYGSSLATSRDQPQQTIEQIIAASNTVPLDPNQEEAVGRLLLGDNLFVSRLLRMGHSRETQAATIRQFFRTFVAAERLNAARDASEQPRSVHQAFTEHVRESTVNLLNRPSAELTLSITDQGMQFLRDHLSSDVFIPKAIALLEEALPQLENGEIDTIHTPEDVRSYITYLQDFEGTIREHVGIDQMKAELEAARNEADLETIAQLEQSITQEIQRVISLTSPEASIYFPRDVVDLNRMQCVSSSLLASAFLSELQIPHLVVDLPLHSSFLVGYANGEIIWQDMRQPSDHNVDISNMHFNTTSTNRVVTGGDLFMLATDPSDRDSLGFLVAPDMYKLLFNMDIKSPVLMRAMQPVKGVSFQMLNNTASSLIDSGAYMEAWTVIEQMIQIDPSNTSAYILAGNTFDELEDYAGAINFYDRALSIYPNDRIALGNKGSILVEQGKYREALTILDRVISLTYIPEESLDTTDSSEVPESSKHLSVFYSSRGIALTGLERYDEALESFELAERANPTNENAILSRAHTLIEMERIDDALASYDKALKVNPQNHDIYRLKAALLAEHRRYKEALQIFQQYLPFLGNDRKEQVSIEQEIARLQLILSQSQE